MRSRPLVATLVGLCCFAGACRNPADPRLDADFRFAADGWTTGFADYRQAQAGPMQLVDRLESVPAPVEKAGHFIGGTNHSDDLFMFFKRRIDTPLDAATYKVDFTIEIATDVPSGCGGIGGSPGESVWLKAGASAIEPIAAADASGNVRLSVDKGNQATGGRSAVVLGTIENTVPCELGVRRWELKTLAGSMFATSDSSGRLWIFVGTDSGFEGRTEIYLTGVTLGLSVAD